MKDSPRNNSQVNIFFASFAIIIALLLTPSKVLAVDEIFGNWASIQPLNYYVASHATLLANDKIYIFGGATSHSIKSITYSDINGTGQLMGWNYAQDLPMGIYYHSLSYNPLQNKAYMLGGVTYPPINSINDVYLIEFDNNIPKNQLLPQSLPNEYDRGGSVILNNRIYFAGGTKYENSTVTEINNGVWFAEINEDGTIGAWQTAGTLPTPLNEFGMVATSNNKFLVIGGTVNASSTPISTVYEFTVNPTTGVIDSMVARDPLPQPIRRIGVVKSGNYVIVAGGANSFSRFSDVYFTEIDANGSPGSWTTSTHPLPDPICCGTLVASNTHLYYVGGYTQNYTNNIYYSSLSFASPAPTPTPTPTPLPNLNVADIKQYTGGWENEAYDHIAGTIKKFGCALTSAIMVLKYHGHNVNPDTLNNWLKNEADGYVRNGLVNWLAISRYTFLNKTESAPALEFRRIVPSDDNLITELKANRPAILKEPGHFIVAKAQTSDSFGINDPGYTNRLTLASYNNTFLNIYSYTPSHTDLSYILLTINSSYNIRVFSPTGTEITGYTFTEAPLIDDEVGSQDGETLKIFAYPKPQTGKYHIEISGPESAYTINSYTYDQSGNLLEGAPVSTTTASLDLRLNYDSDTTTSPVEIVDTTPPVISATVNPTPNADGWNNSNAVLIWSINDPETATSSATGCNTSTINTETSGTTFTCSAESAGGVATKSAVIKLDKNPPSIPFLISPANNGYANTLSPQLIWSASNDSLSGLKTASTYHYQVDNEQNFNAPLVLEGYTNSADTEHTLTLESEGKYYWRIAARDAADLSSEFSSSRAFSVDVSAPSTPGSPVTFTPTNTHSQIWNWTASNDSVSGVLQYIWRVVEGIVGTSATTSQSTSLGEGSWNFFVKARDFAENIGSESKGAILIDTTAPTGSWVSPQANSNIMGSIDLQIVSQDTSSGVKNVTFQYKKNGGSDYFHTISATVWDTSSLPLGEYTLRAVIFDKAGNSTNLDETVGVSAIVSNQASTTPSSSKARITWTTDRATSSRVIYDTASHASSSLPPNYTYSFSTSTYDTITKVLSHSVFLEELSSGKTYYYRTVSEGSPISISSEMSFRTLSVAGASLASADNISPQSIATAPPTAGATVKPSSPKNQIGKPKTKVLGGETILQQAPPKQSFFMRNLTLFLILFASLGGLFYIQLRRLLRVLTNKNKQKV